MSYAGVYFAYSFRDPGGALRIRAWCHISIAADRPHTAPPVADSIVAALKTEFEDRIRMLDRVPLPVVSTARGAKLLETDGAPQRMIVHIMVNSLFASVLHSLRQKACALMHIDMAPAMFHVSVDSAESWNVAAPIAPLLAPTA